MLLFASHLSAQTTTFSVSGRVIDAASRQPVAGALVTFANADSTLAVTDTAGNFNIKHLKPGIISFQVEAPGYDLQITPEYLVSAVTPRINVELYESVIQLDGVFVRPKPFLKTVESPVSVQVIGVREIEKSPGAARDISRIVRGYPGVAFSPVGYRNDLIVRGGGPS